MHLLQTQKKGEKLHDETVLKNQKLWQYDNNDNNEKDGQVLDSPIKDEFEKTDGYDNSDGRAAVA
jgi:uncharacterized protein with ParB-like and HNH nuclease domain